MQKSTILYYRKKLNILAPQHTVLEQEISTGANARGSHWKYSVKKRCSLKFCKIYRKYLCQRKHLVSFAKSLTTPFLQNNSGRLLLKCRHCKNKSREIDCLCFREVNAMFIASAKIPQREESISLSSFYGHLSDYY